MKTLMTIILISFNIISISLASTVNIVPGETISLNSNSNSTVTCLGNGQNGESQCHSSLKFLKAKLKSCLENYTGGYEVTSACIP